MIWKAKMLRAITRKPYGVAYFKINKNEYPKLIRLDNDTIKTSKGVYIIDHSKVYIEQDAMKPEKFEEVTYKDDKPVERKEFNMTDFYTYRQGVPIIYFDYNDMIPLKFENDPFEGTRNPFAVENAISKEISAAEAELMRKTKSKVIKYVLVNIIISAIAIAAVGFVVNNMLLMQDTINSIAAVVGA